MACAIVWLFRHEATIDNGRGTLRRLLSYISGLAGLIHLFLSLGFLSGLAWHVILKGSLVARVPVFVACGVWLLTQISRVSRLLLRQGAYAVVKEHWSDGEVTRLTLECSGEVRIFPGCYFYLFSRNRFPLLGLLHGQPLMTCWTAPELCAMDKSKRLTFLVSASHRHHQLLQVNMGQKLRIEGPYGVNHCLGEYETVILAAKGMGIAGVMSHALHLAARKKHDNDARQRSKRIQDANEPILGDLSRRVDLVWWLEHEKQEVWLRNQFKDLQDLRTEVRAPEP